MKFFIRGFTLLEMLVALAIVAIGLTAALRASGMGTEGVGEYRNHMLALWLAQNIVTEHVARGDWPAPDTTSSEAVFANHRFLVREAVKTTPNPRFNRLDVMISDAQEPSRTLQHSVVFLTSPK
ncbi:MAG: type II secretion system minor pseudopilin GspI [Thiobacillaceae bacterium]